MKHNSAFPKLLAFLLLFPLLALPARGDKPKTADQYINDANEAIQKKDWAAAVQAFTEALKLNPSGSADCYVGRGFVYDSMGKPALAIPDYLQALKVFPRDYPAANNLAVSYYKTKNYAQAVTWATQAMEFGTPNPSLYIVRAGAYGALK